MWQDARCFHRERDRDRVIGGKEIEPEESSFMDIV